MAAAPPGGRQPEPGDVGAVGRGEPGVGAAWHPIGTSGDGSVERLATKAKALG